MLQQINVPLAHEFRLENGIIDLVQVTVSLSQKTDVSETAIHNNVGASVLNSETRESLSCMPTFHKSDTRTSESPQRSKRHNLSIAKRLLLVSAERQSDETQPVTIGSPVTETRVMTSRGHSAPHAGAIPFWQDFVAILRDIRRGKLEKALEYETFLDACCVREVLRPTGGGHFNSNCCSRLVYLISMLKMVKKAIPAH
nr:unnamed protein product [Spirometra erinaceieuropaei]